MCKNIGSAIKKLLYELREGYPMIIFLFVFTGAFVMTERVHASSYTIIHCAVDDMIPFAEIFILPYASWFIYMVPGCVLLYFLDRKTYHQTATALALGMVLFLVISLVWPNALELRPQEMPRDNFFSDKVLLAYRIDTPTNVCPSIHVYDTLIMMTGFLKGSHWFLRHKAFRWFIVIQGILIILSTLFIKQHSVIDVFWAFVMYAGFYRITFQAEFSIYSRTHLKKEYQGQVP